MSVFRNNHAICEVVSREVTVLVGEEFITISVLSVAFNSR